MNKKNLDTILEQYIEKYDLINRPIEEGGNDEGYKWRVIRSFKQHWNIESDYFGEMFQDAMGEISKTNLINNSRIQPVSGLIRLAKESDKEAEFLRDEFKKLFADDGGDLDARNDRINAFMDAVNERVDKVFNGSWRFQQPRNAAIFYLNLQHPKDNFLFKATEASEWADCIEFADDFGSGRSFSLKKYYQMCGELVAALSDYPDLLRLHAARINKENLGFDDQLHILAFDIIYCSHYMGFYNRCPSLGLPTKERIKRAKQREEHERIALTIQTKVDEIKTLKAKYQSIPNIIGKKAFHTKYGEGIITEYNDLRFTVAFNEKTSKFNADAILRGFVKIDDDTDNTLKHNDALNKQINALNDEVKLLMRKLD